MAKQCEAMGGKGNVCHYRKCVCYLPFSNSGPMISSQDIAHTLLHSGLLPEINLCHQTRYNSMEFSSILKSPTWSSPKLCISSTRFTLHAVSDVSSSHYKDKGTPSIGGAHSSSLRESNETQQGHCHVKWVRGVPEGALCLKWEGWNATSTSSFLGVFHTLHLKNECNDIFT